MYLRSLQLQGFKSFPDKTKLTFGKGITAIVGPNGMGKSNIGDAMRWVMGEKSAKSLRSETMDDVIFNGGSGIRKKSGFAQVILTIDNEDKALKNDSEIVTISRTLYRNGGSEYQINGEQVRLKDIEELLMDTGLGRDGYSIISQGKISEIVSSRAGDRRHIFDEAAGISKFRSRKEDAQKELIKAEDNLSRLTDILSELEGRIEPLKKQCEKAKKFKVLDDEKSGLEISLWVYRLNELMTTRNDYSEKFKLMNKQYEDLNALVDELDEQIEDGYAKAAEYGEKAAQYRERIHEIEIEKTQAASKIAVLQNDIEHLNARIEQILQTIKQSLEGADSLKADLQAQSEKIKALEQKKLDSQSAIEEQERRLSDAQLDIAEGERETERINGELNARYLSKSNALFRLENAKNTACTVNESLALINGEKAEQEAKRTEYENEKKRLETLADEQAAKKQEIQNRIAGFTKLFDSKSRKLNTAKENFSENDLALKEISQRLGILRDLENAMEGFAYSVKFMMKAAKQGRITGICGSVASLISVDDEYSVAIETALGGALQNIVTEDENAAKMAIRLLKDNKAGRATFLPLTSVKGRRLDNPPVGESGYVAVASELVSCDKRYSGIVDNLLGRVVVAEDIDCASIIARHNGYKFKIVTLDGQVVNAGGSYTGGSTSKSTGILTRKNEIKELENRSASLEEKNEELKRSCNALTQEVQNLSAQLDGQKSELSQLESDILKCGMDQNRVSELLSQLDDSDEKTEENIARLNASLDEANKQATEAAEEISRLEKEIAKCEKELSVSKDKNAEQAKLREEISSALSDMRISDAEIVKDIQSAHTELDRINGLIDSGEEQRTALEKESDDCKSQIEGKDRQIKDIESGADNSDKEVARLEGEILSAQAKQAEENAAADKLKAEQRNRMNERETLVSELTKVKERRQSVDTEFDKLVGQLWDEYNLGRSEAMEKYPVPDDIKAARIRLNELKQQIKSLGNVNLSAIEEYAEVIERYEFMTTQLDDVNKSKSELLELIDSLTESMKNMFIESFNLIGKHFSRIFTEMFGGGKAELSLTDPNDVLECGIDIRVAPPGKTVNNLMSLSGGESAFVAVCIYFAILTVRPSPFCLLDEIEAAFDDANVAKYAAYLHKFTDSTQFITITHRRGTMEEADVLYGVTMQEKGVSRVLKMTMEETEQLS